MTRIWSGITGEYLKELMAAAGLYDHERVRSLASKLGQRIADDAFAYPSQGAKQILTVLRRNCYFDEMVDLAEVLGRDGQARLHQSAGNTRRGC